MTNCSGFKLVIIFILVSQVTSCYAADTGRTCGIPVILGNNDIESQVADEFKKNNISFSWINGVLCADSKSSESVKEILGSVIDKLLSPGNSASLHQPINTAVKNSLSRKNINFHEVVFQGHTYLVWGEEDSDAVESVIEEEKKRFVRSLEK